jgi:transketolase
METEVMFREALKLTAPSAHCLSRQKLPHLDRSESQEKDVRKGAYAIRESSDANLIIFATGSEVQLALKVADALAKDGQSAKVVSMPCWELFEKQSDSYKEQLLSWSIKNRVSIEAGSTLGWQKFVGHDGLTIGIDQFGASAPANQLEEHFGFTPIKIAARIQSHLK